MIKLEKTDVVGWESAIRGLRNPMNSWDKSDSGKGCISDDKIYYCEDCGECTTGIFIIGENDLTLMRKLSKAGTDHSKFMRMINVTVDITAPLYWWKEYDTYKVGTVANSCSTMHKIHDKAFELDDFSHEHLTPASIELLRSVIGELNFYREGYNTCPMKDQRKLYWWQMIQLLPTSYNQKRTVQLNYQVLKNMYHARKAHKLDEWREFCKWIESLPYAELITEVRESNAG